MLGFTDHIALYSEKIINLTAAVFCKVFSYNYFISKLVGPEKMLSNESQTDVKQIYLKYLSIVKCHHGGSITVLNYKGNVCLAVQKYRISIKIKNILFFL
jgi:hypothetical protein